MNAAITYNLNKIFSEKINSAVSFVGIFGLVFLMIWIKSKTLFVTFEDTRMTTFLLLFSTSLLILVGNCTYISGTREILDRDFGNPNKMFRLSRFYFWLATCLSHIVLAALETVIFVLGFRCAISVFQTSSPLYYSVVKVSVVVFLTFICAHFFALFLSAVTFENSIFSVRLAIIIGILQFSLSNTIIFLPKFLTGVKKFIFLGYAHQAIGGVFDIDNFPSALQNRGLNVPQAQIPVEQLEMFTRSDVFLYVWLLFIHLFVYFLLFGISLFDWKNFMNRI